MSLVPFADQLLSTDYFLSAKTRIEAGKSVSGDDLLRMIEQLTEQQLPEDARSVVLQAVILAVKVPGRPSKFGASLDLALEKVEQRYQALRRYEQRKKHRLSKRGITGPKGDSPSLLAYDRLLRHMKQEFGPMTPRALMNMHSAWRLGRLHPTINDTDSEDFDAEIDYRFPRFKKIINNGGFSNE